jgi:hypothetical protein
MPNCSMIRADCTGVGAIREYITPLLLLIALLLLVLLVVLFWLCPLPSTLCELLPVELIELLVGALPSSTMSSTSRASRVRLACSVCIHILVCMCAFMYSCSARCTLHWMHKHFVTLLQPTATLTKGNAFITPLLSIHTHTVPLIQIHIC